MARHRSPQSRGAHRTPPSPREPLFATTGAGGAHRAVDPTTRRNLLAVGGVAVLAGQVAFSHLTGTTPALPSPGNLLGLDPTESTITELAATAPLVTQAGAQVTVPAQAGAPAIETGALTSRFDGFESVSLTGDPSALQQADAAKLAKAAGLAEAARVAQEQAAQQAEQTRIREADLPSVRGKACGGRNTSGLAGVKSYVSTAGSDLRCIFGVDTLGGLGKRSGASDHPRGLAIDFMTSGAKGDQLADYALKYKDLLRIKYVIWKQRINYGNGWKGMENRGSVTANHFDHVHISFTS